MLWRHVNVEDIAFHDLSSHHRLVNRHCDLFSCTSLSHVFSLVLYPDNLSDPSSTTVDERILLKNMIDDISLEDWNLRYRDLLLGIRQQFHTERQDNSQIWVLDTHRLRLNNVPSRNITDIC